MRKGYGKVPVKVKKEKKDLDKEYEKILTVGEGTVSEAKEVFKEEKEQDKLIKQEEMNRLFDRRRTFFGYNETLAKLLLKSLQEEGIPHGWDVRVAHTVEGVVMELESPNKRFFRSAFKSTGDPYLDSNAIDNFVIRAQNTMEKVWTPPKDRK